MCRVNPSEMLSSPDVVQECCKTLANYCEMANNMPEACGVLAASAP
jgi:hypothetical protein